MYTVPRPRPAFHRLENGTATMSTFPTEANVGKLLLLFSLANRMYISWFTGALSVLPLIQMKEIKEKTATTSLSSRLHKHIHTAVVLQQWLG